MIMTFKDFAEALTVADLFKCVQFMRNRHRYGTPLTATFQRKSSARDPEFFILEMLPDQLITIKRAKFCDDGKDLKTLDESVTYDINAALDFLEADGLRFR